MPGIQVDFTAGGLPDMGRQLTTTASDADRATASMKQLAQAVAQVKAAVSGLPGGSQALRLAGAAGQVNVMPRLPKPPPNFDQRLARMIRSTRFGAGGTMPLIGQSLDLLGMGAMAGPVGAAVAAIKAFTEGMGKATEVANEFGKLSIETGSGPGTVAGLRSLGVSGGQVAAFNQRITTDPTAIALAARMGISNQPGIYGNQDWGAEYLKALRGVRAIKDPTERLRTARGLGIDDSLTMVSDNTFNRMVGPDAQRQGQVFDPKYQQDAAELTAATQRITQAFENLGGAIFKMPILGFTKFTNEMLDLVNGKMTLKRFVTAQGEDEYGNAVDEHKKALDANTDALNNNSQQLGVMGRQYGHGERADAALPRGYGMGSGFNLRQNLATGALRLGVFG